MYIFLYIAITLISCQNDLKDTFNDKIAIVERVVTNSRDSYQFYKVRETSFEVSRIPYDNDNAIIYLSPYPVIEKNFSRGTLLDLLVVKEFANLNCNYLFFNNEFIRVDFFIKQKGAIKVLSKKTKIILFKGNPPQNQKFISDQVVEFNDVWKYLIIET